MSRQLTDNVTLLHHARLGVVTDEMKRVAEIEQQPLSLIVDELKAGRLVIPANIFHRHLDPAGIGRSVRVKINANIGNSSLKSGIAEEIKKVEICERYGADAVMDLSTGPHINEIRAAIIEHTRLPVGTVPIYQAAETVENIDDLSAGLLLDVIETQAKQGVDFMTIHAGLLAEHLPFAACRATGIVSRGGAIIARWMMQHHQQNPFYDSFDAILDICKRYDVTLSLGDGLRPGSLADASDRAQFAELSVLGDLVGRCRKADVQVMVEGPGHVPFNEIEMNMKAEQTACDDAPFYVLGPVVTDIAPGYDHITAAIGATMAAYHGASFLCYVTPKEHLGLPDLEDVRSGIIAFKIAAHAADVALKKPGVALRDRAMSDARFAFDWPKQFSLALDPDRAREYFDSNSAGHEKVDATDYCTMCGPKFCAMRVYRKAGEACPGDKPEKPA
jgi:phosphomethylpyrimidine synthase